MQYWILTTEYPPYFGGGISTYCAEAARILASQGYDVTVLVPHQTPAEQLIVEVMGKLTVVRFNVDYFSAGVPELHHAAKVAYAFKMASYTWLEKSPQPDLIEAQDYMGVSYFIAMDKLIGTSPLKDCVLGITLHAPSYISRSYNAETNLRFPDFWMSEMERFCIKSADVVWTPSRNVVRHLGDELKDISAELIRNPFMMPPVIDDENDNCGIYFFGRVQYLKGIIKLFEAFRIYREKGGEERLNVVGGDSFFHAKGCGMRSFLERRFSRLIADGCISFMGLLPREKALERLKLAKLVVIPSDFENFAYAALEAMALEKVILTGNNTGQAELIEDGVNGFIVDSTVEGLSAALTRALNMTDLERREMGRNARATVAVECSEQRYFDKKDASVRKALARHVPVSRRKNFPFLRISNLHENIPDLSSKPSLNGLLSIVIPYFNLGHYLEDALESAAQVSYEKVEILVLNASSTESSSIAEFYRLSEVYNNDTRFRFEHISDKGLADTRNRGAELARGEFLTFLDADDITTPNYYTKAIEILKNYENVGFVGCWVRSFEGADNGWISWNTEPPYILFHNSINTASIVMKRDVFLRCGKNDIDMFVGMEDYESMVRMVSYGFGGVAIPEFLFKYRVHSDSMMRSLIRQNDILSYERIAEKNSKLFKRHAVELAGLLNGNGVGYKHDNPLVGVDMS
ncbi:glycosyltransferase [Brucella sp. 2716]|uniref:glycosyltransferase n=1 Tax=Brucella sp. 2716 TaxID=2975052 RepID=UPI00217EDD58|nr:glycosyltransferase [Brucella sp. 2716]UWF59417.1 glycosyltransferase [Brucella sp. 2716]